MSWRAVLAMLLMAAAADAPTVGGGNALTLPAQRHLVRVELSPTRATWLLAVQKDGADGQGLVMLRSDDEAQSFRFMGAIQNNWSQRDTADMIVVGTDVALVYSYEGPTLSNSTAHGVHFQWWRYNGAEDTFVPSTPLRVFGSTSSDVYSRAEIAQDSVGRLWVQAFRLNGNGSNTAVITVSSNNGVSFAQQPELDIVAARGGGRLLSLGSRLLFLYGQFDMSTPVRMRIRDDSAPLSTWGPITEPFENIYHGAALSAVATPGGGMHLVYKADNDQRLYYRFFNGTSFSARVLVDDVPDWAPQPATTRVGSDVHLFYNHLVSAPSSYQLRYRLIRNDVVGGFTILDGSQSWKGYPAAAEALGTTATRAVCLYGDVPDPASGGVLNTVYVPLADAGPPPDAGSNVDGGTGGDGGADAGTTEPGAEVLLFADDFNRQARALGPNWQATGLWYTDGRAVSDLNGEDRATESVATCADCRVEAEVIGFGVPDTAVFARERTNASGDRYQLSLRGNGALRLTRIIGGAATILGEAPSGLSSLSSPATLSLRVTGPGPVELIGTVNGAPRLFATDSSAQALTASGSAGMFTTIAGVVFDKFRLYGRTSAPDAGVADAGTVDAGVDAGTPEGGRDGGSPDGGDAGVVDAGTPGGPFTLSSVLVDRDRRFMAVDPSGTAYALSLSNWHTVLASTDRARTWSVRGGHPNGAGFAILTALSNGTLLADVVDGGLHKLARSTDGGATWMNVLTLNSYRALTPHSFAELDGEVFFLEYQSFTGDTTPIRLWASANGGQSWSTRFTFNGHRHGHGLAADPARHALWALFGDRTEQSGVYRSTDGGRGWRAILTGQEGCVVDATVLSDGALLFGQDISYLPPPPNVARLTPEGGYTAYGRLSGPSYSTHAVPGGGVVVGAVREPGGDVYAPGDVSARLYQSQGGTSYTVAFTFPRLSATENARADVYWALGTNELVLELENVQGMGVGGKGFQILRVNR